MKTLSGRYFIAPQVEMAALVEACNQDSDLTTQTAHAMAQRMATEEGESFCVVQVVRLVNPQREREEK